MEVVGAVLKRSSAAGNSIAIKENGCSYSYAQLASHIEKISQSLRIHADCERKIGSFGPRIGIIAKPSIDFVASVLATWTCGGVAVPLAVSYPESELLHVMNDAEISCVLSTEDYQEIMSKISGKCGAEFSLIPCIPSKAETGPLQLENMDDAHEERPALILYTSGTTGKPKGVVHTHKSINAQVGMLSQAWEYSSSDHFLNCLPLHHVHGLFNALLAPLFSGSTIEFMEKFSVRGIWQRWRDCYPENGTGSGAISVFTGVLTMYTRLIQGYEAMDANAQKASVFAARQLRLMMCGSSALPLSVMQRWEEITGHRLLERYGMTEFVMGLSNPLRGDRKGGTVGHPFPSIQVRIAEEDNDKESKGVGVLCVKSPSMFKEYWKLPQVTEQSFTKDGFFITGDACRINEDGYFVILGRTSADIMKVGGYKLSALEIESVLLQHDAVSECCVLGLPEKDYGEAVCAIVVLDPEFKIKNEIINLQELRDWSKDKLAPYKIPSRLFLWDTLPRNAMGKVNKHELKKLLLA